MIALVIGIAITIFLFPYNQHVFVLKHTLIFVLLASIIVRAVKKVYFRLLRKYDTFFISKKLIVLRVFTLLFIIGLLAISRYLQIDFIKLYETPPITNCYYYDEYGNYIHGSRIYFVCPELEIISKSEHELTVRAEYIYPGNKPTSLSQDNSGPWYRGIDGYAIVDIKVEYNDEHFITNFTSQTSMNYELLEFYNYDPVKNWDIVEEGTSKKYYHSMVLSIQTAYSDNAVSQTKKFYIKEPENVNYEDIREIKHHDFTNIRPTYETALDLKIVNREDNQIKFELYNPLRNHELVYLGLINYGVESTELFYQYNPEMINKDFTEISNRYLITDNHIQKTHATKPYEILEYEFVKLKKYYSMIEINSRNIKESKIYELKDFVVVESKFKTYKLYETTFGYQVEEYYFDQERKENPYTDDIYLTRVYYGADHYVFDNNPIELEYNFQPLINLNPMLQYILEKNK